MLWNNDVEVFCASHQKITFLAFNGDCSFFLGSHVVCAQNTSKRQVHEMNGAYILSCAMSD